MAKTKKVESDNSLKNVIEVASKVETKTIEWNGININVKDKLSIPDVSRFVAIASDICFTNSGDYLPEVYNYALYVATITVFTDFKLPESVEEQYNLIMYTDITSVILDHVNYKIYEELVGCVKEKVDYKVKLHISSIQEQSEKLLSSVEEMITKFESIFGSISPDGITDMIKAFSGGGVDEEKIMEAYMKNKK